MVGLIFFLLFFPFGLDWGYGRGVGGSGEGGIYDDDDKRRLLTPELVCLSDGQCLDPLTGRERVSK
jgi:hypothetical protein